MGALNSAHIHGTDVPVEEPSTASLAEVGDHNPSARRLAGAAAGDVGELALEGWQRRSAISFSRGDERGLGGQRRDIIGNKGPLVAGEGRCDLGNHFGKIDLKHSKPTLQLPANNHLAASVNAVNLEN